MWRLEGCLKEKGTLYIGKKNVHERKRREGLSGERIKHTGEHPFSRARERSIGVARWK